MLRDQAHHFLFGFIVFNTFCTIFTIDIDTDKSNNIQNNFVTSIEFVDADSVELGQNVTLICRTNLTDSKLWWTFNDDNITEDSGFDIVQPDDDPSIDHIISHLYIINMTFSKQGNFSCNAFNERENIYLNDSVAVQVKFETRITSHSGNITRAVLNGQATLFCLFEGYPLAQLEWRHEGEPGSVDHLRAHTTTTQLNEHTKNTSLHFDALNKKHNGSYSCVNIENNVSRQFELLVLEKPHITIDFIKALSMDTIYLNWTVSDGNDPENLNYQIRYMVNGQSNWLFYPEKITNSITHKILKNENFAKNTTYSFQMEAQNSQGAGNPSPVKSVTTLAAKPVFVPEVKVTGVTLSSITIKWSQLPPELNDYIHYYQLKLRAPATKTEIDALQPTSGDHFYMFKDLSSNTNYEFQVAACSDYLKECGPWSNVANGTTSDGLAGPPANVELSCRFDSVSQKGILSVHWRPPTNPNGQIKYYNVVLDGQATFTNEIGNNQYQTWGPHVKSVQENVTSYNYYNASANTNYTVKISAKTRHKNLGEPAISRCTMPPTIPDKNSLLRFSWNKAEEQNKWLFKVFIPRISERNGPICCYRIYLIKMEPHKTFADLPSPDDLFKSSYEEVHSNPKGGVYMAEMFASEHFQPEVFLGDEQMLNWTESACLRCGTHLLDRARPKTSTLLLNNTMSKMVMSTAAGPDATDQSIDITENQILTESSPTEPTTVSTESFAPHVPALDSSLPYDGQLDLNSNYTGFVEIIVYSSSKNETLAAYSNYFSVLTPGPTVFEAPSHQVFGIVVQILCALILIVVVLLMALCLLHRYTKQVVHVQGVEMITFRNSFRHLCRSLRGRHRLVSVNPPDMTSIPASELAAIYMDKHRDSDYGFQREFELLPDRFNDRTTRASDGRENIYKNRYPDIKAYDQTRVKLAQVDSIAGSDYINANFVVGYKERKKFICAQGPVDNTVCDFWRMIWEQRLELILMLTNLEEYSKTKCAKYWPDKAEGEKVYGDFAVSHVEETRYSDYIIRRLSVSRSGGRDKEDRIVTQYHYLVWKDFMAPEHPHGIIKFIKRVNEAYSLDKGSILVHCSAGVGRTGTLVALDSLLQQLNEEKQVAIFNTIVDLRHQRNFLVQSLKQYIFIYRALMEVSLYGDTEIPAAELKTTVEKLKQSNGKNKCKMEEEFENIKNVVEDKKSCTVGNGSENYLKNRNPSVIPYDRNRVILTPIPGREHSTYINASFIEGYDNSESFIITQDPLESTITDFWRMISEQNISTIVMLSDLGEEGSRCPRYWPDDETNYDHIHVKYIQSESCPYYTRRELVVTNQKTDEVNMVTQFQYHGWPTVEGEVPEVTRGLIELVDQTQHTQEQSGHNGPVAVHCNYGSDRSSMFVGLSILVQQLRVEKRVDLFTTTRKLKSQRQELINTFAQYEFLHRAIVNYADLHQLSDTT